jgi:hypothetical protein
MTGQEQLEIDKWFDACQKAQPGGTLALLLYVRDGRVYLGRGSVPYESEGFPIGDLEIASELIQGALKAERIQE